LTIVPLLALAQPAASAQPARAIQMSLKQEFGRALFSECRLDVVVYGGPGRASVYCVRNVSKAPPSELQHERALTPEEANQLLVLARGSNLLSGSSVGADLTASDGIFETLKVTESGQTAVLVTSGNSTFTMGSRRNLLELLHTLLNELMKSAKR
jgi:hypothetical protein